MLLAAIPPPWGNAVHVGPLQFRFYGLAIALGVVAAVVIGRTRWEARGGDPDDVAAIATWGVPAGLIGARLYHVVTDHQRFEGRWLDAFAIWKGGLGIPGGVLLGVVAGVWACRRRKLPVRSMLDVVAPAIPVAQAIGRLGNWFNQELFGRPTDLPWALRVEPDHRPDRYADVATFHPTFLYEGLWNLGLAGLIVLAERRRWLKFGRGTAFFVYVAGYGIGRFWVEALRIDAASLLLGVRVNIWTALVFVAVGVVGAVWTSRRAVIDPPPAEPEPEPVPEPVDEPAAAVGVSWPHSEERAGARWADGTGAVEPVETYRERREQGPTP